MKKQKKWYSEGTYRGSTVRVPVPSTGTRYPGGRIQSGGRLASQWWRDLLFVKEGGGLGVGNWVDERVVRAVGNGESWGSSVEGEGGGGAEDYLLGRKIR
ncbi:hypothetical protein A2U01_0003659 [Trifolium medium]|uniref:Uncharacterized protein n=1 Tax=Trifolium medium TaxID=97028 RepID=A0A392M5Z4_9FABA|nr:hypothetical protein [Trifolium medium]